MTCVGKTIVFCGNVKNTGFRRQLWRYANKLGLRGFAANVENTDCVVAFVEGEESSVNEFVKKAESIAKLFEATEVRAFDSAGCIGSSQEGFSIYGCLEDLMRSNKNRFELVKQVLLQCEDLTT